MRNGTRCLWMLFDAGVLWLAFSAAYGTTGERTTVPQTALWGLCGMALFLLCMQLFGHYRTLWRYADRRAVRRLVLSLLPAVAGLLLLGLLLPNTPPPAFWLLYGLLALLGLTFGRLLGGGHEPDGGGPQPKRLLIIGAGTAASMLIGDIRGHRGRAYLPVGCLDDDPGKWGRRIADVPVLGGCGDVQNIVAQLGIDTIIIAIPSAEPARLARLVALCGETGCTVLRLPALYRLVESGELLPHVEQVDPAELLGRRPVVLNDDIVDKLIAGKCIMVTGGGGSIGSELCRQIAALGPRRLVVLDWSENGAYGVAGEIGHRWPDVDVAIAIGSVADRTRMEALFREYRPDVVFHGAAHKHLPLMEAAPGEAIKNNVGGSYVAADLAGRYGCEAFVFISTDKAVNPSCTMGRTKRVGELITAAMTGRHPGCRYVSVRFGNVLGSAGSVIPMFRQQIAMGGPVRVTHPDVSRYFMTIPEAAGLVLTAGGMAEGGEIFVLDMGEPVRIVTLAENLIRLSGLVPYGDIGIVFTGLRPGEKLHEELLSEGEAAARTAHPKIRIAACYPPEAEPFFARVEALIALAACGRVEQAVAALEALVQRPYKVQVKQAEALPKRRIIE